jgi:hypothetical protein
MGALGDRILADDFPGSERDRAEGFRHLANQLCCWLTYSIGHTDPDYPHLFWHNNLTYRWGGPNVDQNGRRAVISDDGTYRLSGMMNACEEFIVQIKTGEMHTGGGGIAGELRASDLGLEPGDRFEIVLSKEHHPGNWLELRPNTQLLHIRDYYWNWEPSEPAMFALERLDTQGVPKPELTPRRVQQMLDEATSQIEGSIVYWNEYQRDLRETLGMNAFGVPYHEPQGVQDIHYCHAFLNLGQDQALVVEVDPSEGDYWDIQIYNRAWYETLDFGNRPTSLNHRLAHHDRDGRIRVVIANSDPGVPNWIDTEGRAEVMSTIRWWHVSDVPTLVQDVVPFSEIERHLPQDTPKISPVERREQMRKRARHIAWQFRS